jgi:hypothetical protein
MTVESVLGGLRHQMLYPTTDCGIGGEGVDTKRSAPGDSRSHQSSPGRACSHPPNLQHPVDHCQTPPTDVRRARCNPRPRSHLIAIRSSAFVSGAVLLAAALVAPPAAADRYTELDPAGDMRVEMARTGEVSPAPSHRKLDMRRVIVRHADHFVFIRAYMRSLTRPQGNEEFHLFGFAKVDRRAHPSESVAWFWEVEFDRFHPRVGGRLFVTDAEHQEEYGCDRFTQKGFKAGANYDLDRVTVIIPRRCLALDFNPNVRPRWVQVSVTTWHQLEHSYFDHLGSQVRTPFPTLRNSGFTPLLYTG